MLTIHVTPLSYRVGVAPNGQLLGTNLFLRVYLKKFNHTVWDKVKGIPILYRRYVRYNEKLGMLYLPYYDLDAFCRYLRENGVVYTISQIPLQQGVDVTIPLKSHIQDRNERQTKAIQYLTTSQESLRGLSLNTGCLVGDTIISCNRARKGYKTTLKVMYEQWNGLYTGEGRRWDLEIPTYVRSYTGFRTNLNRVKDVLYSGIKPVYRVVLDNGRFLICTADHEIATSDGFVEACNVVGYFVMCDNEHAMKSADELRVYNDTYTTISARHPYVKCANTSKCEWIYRLPLHRAIYEAVILNHMSLIDYKNAWNDDELRPYLRVVDPSIYDIHHKDFDHNNNTPDNLECMTRETHKQLHAERTKINFNQGIVTYHEAVSFDYVGEEPTYDIVCEDHTVTFQQTV